VASRTTDLEIARLSRNKRVETPSASPLGPELVAFYKQSVEKRQAKFGKIASYWAVLVPLTLADHCSLESLTRGTLVVLVDTASHLYELKQLLLAGLEQQLLMAAKSSGLRKINLKRGHWCDGEQRVEFGSGSRRATPLVNTSIPQKYVRNRRSRNVE
jgi:hypothetical protein